MDSVYMLKMNELLYDRANKPPVVILFSEKPSISILREHIGINCTFREAADIYNSEPEDYNVQGELAVTLKKIQVFEKADSTVMVESKYENAFTSSQEFLEFLKEFKEAHKDALKKYIRSIRDKNLSLDEIIFDWYLQMNIEGEDNFTIDSFLRYK